MVDKQVTTMVLKVDLQCHRCYKKVKKVLGKFPQIQDQVYDEKQNTVTIKVVCCCPEKIKKKIICKGKGVIKCIDNNNNEPDQPVDPNPDSIDHCIYRPPERACCWECYSGSGSGPCFHGHGGGGRPPWPFGDPYGDGCWGERPVCGESYVIRYECARENYGPCRIM